MSRRTTATTDYGLYQSTVSTVKNSNLACEVTLKPTEEQRNPQVTVQQSSPQTLLVRDRSAVADDPMTLSAILKNATLSILNPLAAAAAFYPAAAGPNPGGETAQSPLQSSPPLPSADQTGERLSDARGAADSVPT